MRKIVILIFSIIIYFLLIFVYNNGFKNNFQYVYVLNSDVYRNNKIKYEDFVKIKMKKNNNIKTVSYIDKDCTYNNNYNKNMILTEDMINNSNNILNLNELISIKIKNIDDCVSYKIQKNNYVSIYVNCKFKDIKDNLEFINSEKFVNNENGYITFKLFDKIKIIEICDENGNYISENNKKIDTILVDLKKEDILKINTLKKIGTFSLSLVG